MSATAVFRCRSTFTIPAVGFTANVDGLDVPGDSQFSATTNTMAQIIVDPDNAITTNPQTIEIGLMLAGGTFTVNTGTDVVTTSGAHGLGVDDQFTATTTTTLPAPLVSGTTYYVKTAPSSTTLTLAATPGGTTIDLTTTGTGTHSWQHYGAIGLSYPYGAPAVAVQVKDRRDGTVNDFSVIRAVQILVIPKDDASNASGAGWLTCGNSADPLNSFCVPWELAYVAAGTAEEKVKPSALIILPEGIDYSSSYPLTLAVKEGLTNANLRIVINLLGN